MLCCIFNVEFLAIVLLAGDPGENVSQALYNPTLCEAIKEKAVEMELIETREKFWFFQHPLSFPGQVKELQIRFQHFKDVPKAADALNFRSYYQENRKIVQGWLEFNREYRINFGKEMELVPPYRWQWYQETLWEANQLHRFWDTILYLGDPGTVRYSVYSTRSNLKIMQEVIGKENYRNGMLPPFVPLWRFQEVD